MTTEDMGVFIRQFQDEGLDTTTLIYWNAIMALRRNELELSLDSVHDLLDGMGDRWPDWFGDLATALAWALTAQRDGVSRHSPPDGYMETIERAYPESERYRSLYRAQHISILALGCHVPEDVRFVATRDLCLDIEKGLKPEFRADIFSAQDCLDILAADGPRHAREIFFGGIATREEPTFEWGTTTTNMEGLQ